MKIYGYKHRLRLLIDANNSGAARLNKIVGYETRQERKNTLFLGFQQLRELGYRLDDPHGFKPKHMRALAQKWEADGLSTATIQNRISIFRVFCGWIGKQNMLGDSTTFVVNPNSVKRQYVATEDKSWSAKDVSIDEIIAKAEQIDPRVALYLELANVFGMRAQETYMFKPRRSDKEAFLAVSEGTKGGRDRAIPMTTEEQRRVIEKAKAFAQTVDAHIGFPGKTKAQTHRRFYYILQKLGITRKDLGVTFHGLRHEYGNNLYAEKAGVESPVRGGEKIDREEDRAARLHVSEALGHSRESVTGAYIGPILRKIRGESAEIPTDERSGAE